MMSLLKKERYLTAAWMFTDPKDHLKIVGLDANALSNESGFLGLTYEFEGWQEYAGERESKKADVF